MTTSDTSITITYGGKTTTVSVTVEEPEVEKIEVSGYISTYTEGQSFNPSGMKVTVTYTGNIPAKTITDITNNNSKGVTWSPADALPTGDSQVTITYKDEKGSAFTKVDVTVTSNTVDGEGFTYDKTTQKATITSADGLQNLFKEYKTEAASADITLKGLESGETYTVTEQLTDNFAGTLTNDSGKAKIELSGGASLFGTIADGAEVSNLDITVSSTITGNAGTPAGAVAGENNGKITGCNVTISNDGEIDGSKNGVVGGVVGQNNKTISNCTVTINGIISSGGNAGGVAGYSSGSDAKIENCRVESGTIQGTSMGIIGGIVGSNSTGSKIIGCSSAAAVMYGGTTGGIAGDNYSKITASYSTGNVTGRTDSPSHTGGVVGYNDGTGTVTACYWGGNATRGVYNNSGGTVDATKVTDGDWQNAVTQMNAALESAGSQWRYSSTGTLIKL